MTFEAKKSINLISKSGCPILHALKINKQFSYMATTVSGVYTDVVVLFKPNIFSVPIVFGNILCHRFVTRVKILDKL